METVLSTRKKTPKKERANPKKGKVIRCSTEVIHHMESMKKPREGWDAFIRRLLGMPTRKGEPQEKGSITYYLVESSGKVYRSLSQARGEAVRQAVANKTTGPEPIVKLKRLL